MDWIFLTSKQSDLVISISILLIVIALFLIFRSLVLWYWRVNKIVRLLEEINFKLERLPRRPEAAPIPPETAVK